MSEGRAPRIDCHAHIYTRDMPLAPDAWHRPNGDATAAQFLTEMERAGVTHGVLAAASLYGDHNDYSLEVTSANSNLKTTVIVSPDIAPGALTRMAEAGASGVRLQLRNRPIPDLVSPAYGALLGEIDRLGWHIELHDDLERLPSVIAAVERYGVRLVIDHFGRPESVDALDGAAFRSLLDAVGRGRTWVKVSAGFRLESQTLAASAFERLLAAGGPERLMWGSDWPFAGFEGQLDYDRAIVDYRALAGDPALLDAIDSTGFAFYFGG